MLHKLGIRIPASRHCPWFAAALLALLSVSVFVACADGNQKTSEPDLSSNEPSGELQQAAQPDLGDQPRGVDPGVTTASYDIPLGSAGLNERVFDADVIARVRLLGTQATTEQAGTNENGDTVYRGVLEFSFEVLEYLKGDGDDEIVVGATVEREYEMIRDILDRQSRGEFIDWNLANLASSENPYTNMEQALIAAKAFEKDRDTRWDDREAIILVRELPVSDSNDDSTRYSFGAIFDYSINSSYQIWLPSASDVDVGLKDEGGEHSSDDARFLLEVPGRIIPSAPASYRVWLVGLKYASGEVSPLQYDVRFITDAPEDVRSYLKDSVLETYQDVSSHGKTAKTPVYPATVSVNELMELITRLDAWREAGQGVDGHLECIRRSFVRESEINGYKERGESAKSRFDHFLASGLPAGTVVDDGSPWPGRVWLEGEDKDLFDLRAYYDGVFRTTRPLPMGEYLVYFNFQGEEFITCDYHSEELRTEWFVHVTAPDGTLHEAFFDPVEVGAAVGADASSGVLEPASFEVEGVGATSIVRIAWESASAGTGEAGRVRMEFSPSRPPLVGHHVDFIALDGSVVLRLSVDDAAQSVDGDGTTLTWGVCKQPWESGDKLMLRISESGPELSGVTNDAECPSSGQ